MDYHKAEDIFNKNAVSYQERFMDVSCYGPSLDLFCSSLPEGKVPVLDVACGPGNLSRYVLQQRPELQLLGIDLAPAMLDLARSNNPDAEFRLMDARQIATLPEPYAGIVIGFILPYLSREEAGLLIRDAAGLLADEGILYLSTMEDEYTRSGWETSSQGDRVYMYYHEGAYLLSLLQENSLQLLDLKRQPYTNRDGRQETDLVLLARKQ